MPLHGLAQAPIPNMLIAAGIIFLFVAVVGELSGKFDADTKGRIAGGLIGPVLIVLGLLLSPQLLGSVVGFGTPVATGVPTDSAMPSETVSPTVSQATPGPIAFQQPTYTGERGDEVAIEISLGEFDRLYLVVGDPNVNFVVEAWIRDGTRDHTITVILDTDAPNSEVPILRSKSAGDAVTVERESYSSALGNLEAGNYDLHLFQNGFKENREALATLVIEEAG